MNRKFSDQEQVRREKLVQLITLNCNPYMIESVNFSHSISTIAQTYSNFQAEAFETNQINCSTVGRVMTIRQTFALLKNDQANLQIYFNAKKLKPDALTFFKNFVDLGDVLQVEGNLFKTRMGELTLNVTNFMIIAKALHPLPDKHHGLKDPEIRLRKRYVDALINDELLATFKLRSKIINTIRTHLNELNYLEVETPFLQPNIGGAAAKPFITYHNNLEQNFYLRIATELPLKKMVVAGLEKVYEIGRCFRNEGVDATHNPEFTSLEMYTAYEGMHQTIERCENIFQAVCKALKVSHLTWNNHQINLKAKFVVVQMHDLVYAKTGIDFYNQKVSLDQAMTLVDKFNLNLQPHQHTIGHIFNALFETLCEPELIQPTFVCGHHKDVSPLAKSDLKNPDFTLRFELFIGAKELANGFAELTDPIDQLARFEAQVNESKLGNSEANQIDHSFVDALEYGLVPTGGLGIGIDRLVMLFTQQATIKNVIFFPHLRNEN